MKKIQLSICTTITLITASCSVPTQNNIVTKKNNLPLNQQKIEEIIANKKLRNKTPYTFAIKAITPTIDSGIINYGQRDIILNGSPKAFYFHATVGQTLTIKQSQNDGGAAFLRLFDPSGKQVAFNDDSIGLDSLIVHTIPSNGISGLWKIVVNTYQGAGYPSQNGEATQSDSGIVEGSFQLTLNSNLVKSLPSVANDKNGNSVVVWEELSPSNGWDIYAQRYNSSGVKLGDKFMVNQTITGNQANPKISMNRESGNFVIVWDGNGNGDESGIYTRRFNADGTSPALWASELRMNYKTNGIQSNPDIAMRSDGGYNIVWQTTNSSDNTDGIYLGRIIRASDDNLFGSSENRINQTLLGEHLSPSIAIVHSQNENNNKIVITWSGNGSGDESGIYTRRFNADGTSPALWASELRMNFKINGIQSNPDIVMDSNAGYTSVWQNTNSTDSTDGIYIGKIIRASDDNLFGSSESNID